LARHTTSPRSIALLCSTIDRRSPRITWYESAPSTGVQLTTVPFAPRERESRSGSTVSFFLSGTVTVADA